MSRFTDVLTSLDEAMQRTVVGDNAKEKFRDNEKKEKFGDHTKKWVYI